jgi:two-component system, chemotaxis family, sensor histidine kinase and response regulator PixL
MYIDPELRDRVYQLFSSEVPKMLETIETELVSLGTRRDEKTVHNLLRAAHSIKGSAASLGLTAITDLAHQLEDIFRVLNHPELPFDRELELLLFEAYDCLNKMILAEISREVLPAQFQIETQIFLADLDEKIGHFVIAGQKFPSGHLDDLDVTRLIFEVDVAQSLDRLAGVLADPGSAHILVGEFRAQAEVFTGIASLTNLPGFGVLAHTTLAALERHPDRIREICNLALADFYTAAEAVLTGDKATCGTISPEFAVLIAAQSQAELMAIQLENEDSWDLEDSFGYQAAFDVVLPPIEVDFVIEELLVGSEKCGLGVSPLGFVPWSGNPTGRTPPSGAPFQDSRERGVGSWELGAGSGGRYYAADRECRFDLEEMFDLPDLAIDSPMIADGSSLRFDLEDIFDLPDLEIKIPAIGDGSSLRFDLEDIFDLPNWEICSRSIADRSSLRFDLEDIFDLPDLEIKIPAIADRSSLKFDLEDIFDLPPIVDLTLDLDLQLRQQEIRSMVSDLIRDFDKFEPINASTFAPSANVIKPIRIKKSRKIATTATSQLSVRVTLDRLERMNNLMGELAIERNGLALSNEQSTEILHRLRSKCVHFQTIGDKLQQLADTLAISTQYSPALRNTPALAISQDLDHQFDLLELDRYSEIHQIAQATIEQIAQIEEQIEDLALFTTQSHSQIDRQKQQISHLRDDLMWARMLPLGEILNRFPRTLHDLSIEFNKPVDLKITGAGVLVDRAVIDKLLDPLVHLLRNAFDHGIDLPAARQAMGKPERGSIEITAYHQGSQTVIEVTDDGRGIDIDKIRAKAIALKLYTTVDAALATKEQLFDLLFTPGFSTADKITKLSGRGMGLDIVKEQIESTKGTVSIDSQVGQGTTFTLCIPLTLTIAQLMVCQVGNAVYAFPADSIQKIVVPTPNQLSQQADRQVFHWQNLTIPVYKLTDLLTYSIPVPERTISHTLKSSADNPADWLPPLLLIRRANRIIALEIDRLITEQELTIKPFGKAIKPPSYSYGCTILGDGIILPVLDPHTLIQVLIDRPLCPLQTVPATLATSSKSILVVDDSITTRQSLCLTLEKFGYRSFQAKDGQEALQILRQKASEIALVVCDVEMPIMNGFEFLNVYRQDKNITHIPVVMLTSRSNIKHRQFATHLGAVDYFIKPYVEQEFMSSIDKIITNK